MWRAITLWCEEVSLVGHARALGHVEEIGVFLLCVDNLGRDALTHGDLALGEQLVALVLEAPLLRLLRCVRQSLGTRVYQHYI